MRGEITVAMVVGILLGCRYWGAYYPVDTVPPLVLLYSVSCSFIMCICHYVNWQSRSHKQAYPCVVNQVWDSTALNLPPTLFCVYQCTAWAGTSLICAVELLHMHANTCTYPHAHTCEQRTDSSHLMMPVFVDMMGLWRCSFRLGLQWTSRPRWRIIIMIQLCSSVTCSVLLAVFIVH